MQVQLTSRLKTNASFFYAVFSNLTLFRKHLKTAHVKMATFKCGSCPKAYFSARGLRNHREAHKEVPASENSDINHSKENPPVLLPAGNYVIDLAKDVDLQELVGSNVTFV